MGPAFAVLFWLIIAGVAAVIWGGALVVMMVAALNRWRVVKILAGVPVVTLPLLALLIGGFFAFGIVRASIPRYVFADTFQRAPDASISDIKSDVFWFADTGSIYLRFETDVDTFRSLVPAELTRVTSEHYNRARSGHSPGPEWWTDSFPSSAEIYFLGTPDQGHGRQFTSESTVLAYIPEQRRAYYHFIGID